MWQRPSQQANLPVLLPVIQLLAFNSIRQFPKQDKLFVFIVALPTFSNPNEGHVNAGVRAEQLTNNKGNHSIYKST